MIKQNMVEVREVENPDQYNMPRWTTDRKIKYNLKYFFSVAYLMKVGFDEFLNFGGYNWHDDPDWQEIFAEKFGEVKMVEVVQVGDKTFRKEIRCREELEKEMGKYFTDNPAEYQYPREAYAKYIPRKRLPPRPKGEMRTVWVKVDKERQRCKI